jgi:predicted anti-sigma-YlaC factor YlaD
MNAVDPIRTGFLGCADVIRRTLPILALALPLLGACSIRSLATSKLADALSAGGDGYASDEDPELVREAVPFALKTMEQLHAEQPRHVGLLTSLASGFTSYAYAFVQQDADRLSEVDVARGRELELRARKLYLRARDYGLAGLEVRHPGLPAAIRRGGADEERALAEARAEDVPLLYWTAAAWTLAIAAGKDEMKLVGELPYVEPIMARALALDEAWDEGTLHEFYVAYDASRSAAEGGGPDRARMHLQRALALSKNRKVGAIVSFAEAACVGAQDRAEFTRMLQQVLGFDVDSAPRYRLANTIAKRRAAWLLSRTDELFAGE